MKKFHSIQIWALVTLCAASSCVASAQQPFYRQLRANNTSIKEVQPTWMGPLIQSDVRLAQAMRFSVANSSAAGTRTLSYGNNHGLSAIAAQRVQIDFDWPAFFRNHSSTRKDGFGNAATQVKYRIVSGNADHGNFAVSAILYHAFAPRIGQNGMQTSYYSPALTAGKAWGRFALIESLGGRLPTGKTALQGRTIQWNSTAQVHVSKYAWVDLEDNAAFSHGGSHDGKTQNFLTPVAFYTVRRSQWKPEHASIVFVCGMQIATSSFHSYNHNLITEIRLLY